MIPLLLLLACSSGKDTDADSGTADSGDSGDTGADSGDTGDSGDTASDTGADSGGDVVSEDDRAAIERKLTTALSRSNATAAQLAVWRDGEIILTLEVGETYRDSGVPITADTLFQCGSDTKKMAAIIALREVAAGGMALDDTVADVLEGYSLAQTPRWAAEATLHDLLSHQGGLFDYTPWEDAPDDAVLGETVNGVAAERLWAMAPAGAMWNYANPNFSYAGYLTEAVAGRPWADIVEDDLFAPLGMTHTYARASEAVATGDAIGGYGYSWDARDDFDPYADFEYTFGYLPPEAHTDNAFTRPAGMVWTTASDLTRLAALLIDGDPTILPDDLRGEITTGHVPLYPYYEGLDYGYGLFVQQGFSLADGYHDVAMWSHGGNTLTQTSLTWWLPEQRLVVQILSNGYGDDFSPAAGAVLERLAGLGEPDEAPDDSFVETDHAQLVGSYVDAAFGPMNVTDEDGTLYLDMPFLGDLGYPMPQPLTPYIRDLYIASSLGLDFTFIEGGGQYSFLRNRSFVGNRVATEVTTGRRPTRAQVERALLQARTERPPLPGHRLGPAGTVLDDGGDAPR